MRCTPISLQRRQFAMGFGWLPTLADRLPDGRTERLCSPSGDRAGLPIVGSPSPNARARDANVCDHAGERHRGRARLRTRSHESSRLTNRVSFFLRSLEFPRSAAGFARVRPGARDAASCGGIRTNSAGVARRTRQSVPRPAHRGVDARAWRQPDPYPVHRLSPISVSQCRRSPAIAVAGASASR